MIFTVTANTQPQMKTLDSLWCNQIGMVTPQHWLQLTTFILFCNFREQSCELNVLLDWFVAVYRMAVTDKTSVEGVEVGGGKNKKINKPNGLFKFVQPKTSCVRINFEEAIQYKLDMNQLSFASFGMCVFLVHVFVYACIWVCVCVWVCWFVEINVSSLIRIR